MSIQACVNTSVIQNDLVKKMHGDEMCIIKKPIFTNTEIPVPLCDSENKYPAKVLVGEVCNSNEVGQCGEHMTCTMSGEEDSQMGKCECLSSFRQQADRTCVENSVLSPPHPRVQEAGGAAQAVVAVICVLILVVASVLGVLLFRWVFTTVGFH